MITVKQLKELLEQVPDDAKIIAYENELSVFRGELFGRIEAGADSDSDEHDLAAFIALVR